MGERRYKKEVVLPEMTAVWRTLISSTQGMININGEDRGAESERESRGYESKKK